MPEHDERNVAPRTRSWRRRLLTSSVCCVLIASGFSLAFLNSKAVAAETVETPSAAASEPPPEKKKKKSNVPTVRQIDFYAGALKPRDISPFEAIGAKLGKKSSCEFSPQVVNLDAARNASRSHIRIIDALVSPLGYSSKNFTFEWYKGDIANCRTVFERKNTFQCTTKVIDLLEMNPNKDNQTLLGFLFAHELAHILLGHDKGAAQKAKQAEALQKLASVAAIGGLLANAKWSKGVNNSYTAEIGPESMKSLFLAAGLGQAAVDSACELAGADYAKSQEAEADYLAMDMLLKARWDGKAPKNGVNPLSVKDIQDFLRKLNEGSQLELVKTKQAATRGLQELGATALMNSFAKEQASSSGMFDFNNLAWTTGFKLAFGFYADYKNREQLAFHPDPVKRAANIDEYVSTLWGKELDVASLQSNADEKQKMARNASFNQGLVKDRQALDNALTAPTELYETLTRLIALEGAPPEEKKQGLLPMSEKAKAEADAKAVEEKQKYDAEIRDLRGKVEFLNRQVLTGSAMGDFAKAGYFNYKQLYKSAVPLALASTRYNNSSPQMVLFAVDLLLRENSPVQASTTVNSGVDRWGESEFYLSLINVARAMKDEKKAEEVRGRCAVDISVSKETRSVCLALNKPGDAKKDPEPAKQKT